MGIDSDLNGVFYGDEMPPSLIAARSDAGVLISWPSNAAGVVLESGVIPSPHNRETETSVQSISSLRLMVTVLVADRNRFYRLGGL